MSDKLQPGVSVDKLKFVGHLFRLKYNPTSFNLGLFIWSAPAERSGDGALDRLKFRLQAARSTGRRPRKRGTPNKEALPPHSELVRCKPLHERCRVMIPNHSYRRVAIALALLAAVALCTAVS